MESSGSKDEDVVTTDKEIHDLMKYVDEKQRLRSNISRLKKFQPHRECQDDDKLMELDVRIADAVIEIDKLSKEFDGTTYDIPKATLGKLDEMVYNKCKTLDQGKAHQEW